MKMKLGKLFRKAKRFFLTSNRRQAIFKRPPTPSSTVRDRSGHAGRASKRDLSTSKLFLPIGDNWQEGSGRKPVAILWGFPRGKQRLVSHCLPDYRTAFARGTVLQDTHKAVLNEHDGLVMMVWGMSEPPGVTAYAYARGIPIYRVADGFIQNASFGDWRVASLSIVLDRQGIYFDASRPSELEHLLSKYAFEHDQETMLLALSCLETIRTYGLSQYSGVATHKASLLYGPKVKRRVLVLGEVEDSPFVLYGCAKTMTNMELIKLVAEENPEAQILYKPHPDVLSGRRTEMSDLSEVSALAEIISTPMSVKDALHEVDQVYTLTSIAGFEALIHGVRVTTLGAPFYSGWGLTEDRQITGRRHRQLSLQEVFAGAYLLYARYRDPVTRNQTSLPAVLHLLKEKLAETSSISPDLMLQRMKLLSFATQSSVNSGILLNSSARSIAIISDNADALLVAKGIADKGKKVTLLFTTDALANSDNMLFTLQGNHDITISSLHKLYSVALSEIEIRSVELARTFAADLSDTLTTILGQSMSPAVIRTLTLGLENAIYFDALRFHAAGACLKDFDSVLLLIDDVKQSSDAIQSFRYHSRIQRSLGKLFSSSLKGGATKASTSELFEEKRLTFAAPVDEAQLTAEFTAFWKSVQDPAFDEYAKLGSYIAVCGNVANNNYAYAPATMKLVEIIFRESAYPVLFYSSGLLNADGQDTAKRAMFSRNLSERCTVFNGCLPRYLKKYPRTILERSEIFSKGVLELFLEATQRRLPHEVIGIFRSRLAKYVQNLFTQVIFIAESTQVMSKCRLVATAMDRTSVSRILCAIAKDKDIPSIGIQPQIMSVSPRYWSPAVDRMGVIDASQLEIYRKLGAQPDTLEIVGSVNYVLSLRRIESCTRDLGVTANLRSVLFVMQHSNVDQMIATSLALRSITGRHDLSLIVKPHPHQELAVLHEVRRIFGSSTNATVLPREGDTYAALARCGTVVGLNSNVLLEAAIVGKPVLIAAFKDLDSSIDFSVLGVALKSIDAVTLEQHLLDVISDGPLSKELARTREHYMRKNPHFLPPYTHEHIESFIASALPQPVPVDGAGDHANGIPKIGQARVA